MPKRKSYRGRRRQGRRVKRRRMAMVRRPMGTINRFGSGFPAQRIVKLKYIEHNYLSVPATAESFASRTYRSNSIYDPVVAAGGGQPLGYDQWLTFYDHYCVVRSKITVRFHPFGGDDNSAKMAILVLADDTSISAGVSSLIQVNHVQFKSLHPRKVTDTVLKRTYNAKKWFNIKDVKDNLLRLGAAFNANPSEGAVFHVCCGSVFGVTAYQQAFTVCIQYTVLLSEPRELSISS